MTPARQLAGGSRADAGGGGGGGPGAGLRVPGAVPVAARPEQSALLWSAPWVRSWRLRRLVVAEGVGNALEKSAVIRVTHLGPPSLPCVRGSPALVPERQSRRLACLCTRLRGLLCRVGGGGRGEVGVRGERPTLCNENGEPEKTGGVFLASEGREEAGMGKGVMVLTFKGARKGVKRLPIYFGVGAGRGAVRRGDAFQPGNLKALYKPRTLHLMDEKTES